MAEEKPELHLVAEVGQKALIEKDGKMLLVQYPDTNEWWDLPGGRIHKGEEPHEGLLREVKEEVGLDIVVGLPLITFVQHDSKPTWPRYFVLFSATLVDPNQQIFCARDEIKDAQWFTPKEVIEKLSTWQHMGRVVKELLQKGQ